MYFSQIPLVSFPVFATQRYFARYCGIPSNSVYFYLADHWKEASSFLTIITIILLLFLKSLNQNISAQKSLENQKIKFLQNVHRTISLFVSTIM